MNKELSNQIVSNGAEINITHNTPSPASSEPTDIGKVLKAKEANELLNISSSKLTLLYRRGVLRRFNMNYWGGYYDEDVKRLAAGYKKYGQGSKKAARLEQTMADEHMSEHLANLSYTETVRKYKEACANPSVKLSKIFRKMGGGEDRPTKQETLYHYMYLADHEHVDLQTALTLRDWARKTSKAHVRYEVNKISLPPVSAWDDPRHAPLVKMLIGAATDKYGIEFDTMTKHDYNLLALMPTSSTVFNYFNGKKASSSKHIQLMLDDAITTGEHIPLATRVDYWYRCMDGLMKTARFSPVNSKYLDSVCRSMLAPSQQSDFKALASAKEAIDKAVGSFWPELYDSKWLPAFVGELPYVDLKHHADCFSLNPWDKQLNPDFDADDAPEVMYLRTKSSLQHLEEHSNKPVLKEFNNRLMRFHERIALALPIRNRVDTGIISTLIKILNSKGVDPYWLYVTPYEHVDELYGQLDDIELCYSELLDSLGLEPPSETIVSKAEASAIALSEDAHEEVAAMVVSSEDRAMFVRDYLTYAGIEFEDSDSTETLLALLGSDFVKLDTYIYEEEWGLNEE